MGKPYKKGGKGGGATKAVKHALPCKYFQRGKCTNPNCPYLHVKEKGAANGSADTITASSRVAATTDVTFTMLKLFFEKHQFEIYNAEMRLLNLNALGRNAELLSIAGSINFNNHHFCEALCKCVAACIVPPPSIIAFENNGISSLYHLANEMKERGLSKTLQAVSFAQNDIKTCDFVKELKSFTNLVELNMLGNPAADLPDYKQKVRKLLPFLTLLDTVSVAAAPLTLPWPLFYRVDETVTGPSSSTDLVYDSVQRDILRFIQTVVLNPLEQEPCSAPSGGVVGVDAVSEAYALNACLSISLSCPEAAVATPQSSGSAVGANGGMGFRNMVREIVGFRIRQTESDHNLLRGGKGGSAKAVQVATGRTQVCSQLEHWLYPKAFSVGHYIHASPDVAVLDNNGMGPAAPVQFKEPVAVVTLHGVMVWRFRPDGPTASTSTSLANRSLVLIKRNFSRVLTVAVAGPGDRWQIANDMISLYPFSGSAPEDDAEVATAAAVLQDEGAGQLDGTGASLEGGLFADLNPYDVVFSPAIDPKRAAAVSRRYQVPLPVVALLTKAVSSDSELAAVLSDVQGLPLVEFESAATAAGGDTMAGVFLCRLKNTYGVEVTAGLKLLTQFGLDWVAILGAVTP